MTNHETRIIIAGFGGQGVVVAGNIIARACVIEGKNITGMVSYGAEMRGGTANSTVVVSDGEIASPFVERPDIAIILNQPSLEKFEPVIRPGGLAVLNSSLIDRPVKRTDLDIVNIDATHIAHDLGNVRVANIVALGAFVEKTALVKMSSVSQAIEDMFSSKKAGMVEINRKAFLEGARLSVTS